MNPRPAAGAVSHLPVPDAHALAHSRKLSDLIRAEIRDAGGAISFRRYMELALYAPGAGYYSAGAEKFGPGGDFVTAPGMSPLFSRCVARQCAEVLAQTDGVVLELGAGSGAMACDVLQTLDRCGALPREYLILETSADLRARQQQRIEEMLPEIAPRVRWLDRLPRAPLRGVIVANEVLDALPVHRVRIGPGISELAVGAAGEDFTWQARAAPPDLSAQVERVLAELPEAPGAGYQTEFNTDLGAWLATFAEVLEAGLMLIVDYGYPRREYYHPDRRDGTLVCHYRHRAHWDPFLYPGLQDISASVDFTAVAEAGTAAGLDLLGFTTQAHFLIGCGIGELAEAQGAGAGEQLDLAQDIRRLTLPGAMGERFKAMALGRGVQGPLVGFTAADHRRYL